MTHRSIKITAALALLAAALAPAEASASSATLVAVTPFGGPGELAREAHRAVVGIISVHHQVVSSTDILRASAEAGGDVRSPSGALSVGRLTGADALVIGTVEPSGDGFKLAIAVRDARSGRSIGAVLVPLFAPQVVSTDSARIEPLVLNLIEQLGPSSRAEALESELATGSGSSTSAEVIAETSAANEPLPVTFRGSAGLNMTSRSLRFASEPEVKVGADIDRSVAMGVRIDGEVTTLGDTHAGIAVSVDRAVGARVAFGPSDERLELPVRQQRWSLAAIGVTRFKKVRFSGSLGYASHEVSITARPENLRVPDTFFGAVALGVGARYEFRRDTMAVFGAGRFLHVFRTAGITNPETFGTARSRGLDVDAGFELALTSSLRVRAGIRMSRISVRFDGNGVAASDLDDDVGQDVSSALDSITGLYALVAFQL